MSLSRLPRFLALALPLLVFTLFGLWLLRTAFPTSSTVSYPDFTRLLEAGQVEQVVVRDDVAQVRLTEPAEVPVMNGPQPVQTDRFAVHLPGNQATPDASLISQLEGQGVAYRFEAPSQWFGIGLNFLPVLLFFLLPLAVLAALLAVLARRGRPRTP
ncbi:ATP-dependent Zn protease [Deinococcus sp. HSC-46F16]|uniref:ATP-dependent metallopeptidase FtsH/Yme1/Tma family protein n=1 Tax=Deinococcus sp. HSC-46F16 TaxID=2910968 RepID=UPI0020A063AA|nr:ATP-dependent metallopeptidase FtsH/Yme1/Tma family protein [Deinococcus sp. HSC-46F16]MCP2014354.1 ATP-dependent Zn protease [Deinococcus sp. HSC-46F16]